MKRIINTTLITYMLVPYTLMAEQPKSSWLQLHKLNQSSQQALQQIQRAHVDQTDPSNSIDRRNHKRILEQNSLQESQRRNQIIYNQRRKLTPADLLGRKQISDNQTDRLNAKNRLNQRQILEQTNLQESQRRKQIIFNQSRRLRSTNWQDRIKANIEQQRFSVEQRNQLNRFRIQQQLKY